MQSVYFQSDLAAAGLQEGDSIQALGFMIGVSNVGSFQTAAPTLNNVRISSTWLPASLRPAFEGIKMRTWVKSSYTFTYNAGQCPNPPLATKNLLENTDGVLHRCSLGTAACYLLVMLTRALS